MIAIVVGALRMAIVFTIVSLGTATVWLTSFLPIRIRNAPLCGWITLGMARSIMRVLNLELICSEQDRAQYRQHHGFIFPNHKSYMDAVVVMSIFPVRFVADKRIQAAPFVGRIGDAIDVVFVDLFDKQARSRARNEIADIASFPPIVLFPEGAIKPGTQLHPLRYGAFDIAIRAQLPVIPALIVYEQHDLIYWSIKEGSILAAIWRVASHLPRKTARLQLLPAFTPQADDDPIVLSEDIHAMMSVALAAQYPLSADETVLPTT
jgi:1-acyl-sn-glycerol-3-phosphate acyltransferase